MKIILVLVSFILSVVTSVASYAQGDVFIEKEKRVLTQFNQDPPGGPTFSYAIPYKNPKYFGIKLAEEERYMICIDNQNVARMSYTISCSTNVYDKCQQDKIAQGYVKPNMKKNIIFTYPQEPGPRSISVSVYCKRDDNTHNFTYPSGSITFYKVKKEVTPSKIKGKKNNSNKLPTLVQ